MSFKIRLSLVAIILSTVVWSQTKVEETTKRSCGFIPSPEWDEWFNERVEEYKKDIVAGKTAVNYVLPVIVHIIHSGQNVGTYPNVTQAQVNSQIPVLNNDFAGTGLNASNLPQAFSGMTANCNISFCLAQLDPNGNLLPEPGIERINFNSIAGAGNPAFCTSSSSLISLFDTKIKPATIWDPVRYFNIWISDVNQSAGILGYATFPIGTTLPGISNGDGTSTKDGIWVWSRSFGTTGFVNAPYHKGRTATHETGHWMGLRHIWGDANCGNDYCTDTPVQQTSNFNCPSYPKVTCSNGPSGEMFMNFMDYCDDACLYMFTPDQRTRMQTAMTNGTYRNQLTASSVTLCNISPIAPTALFSSTNETCRDSLLQMNNETTGVPNPTYTWTAIPSTGVVFSPSEFVANPTVYFSLPGTYSIILVANNSSGETSFSRNVDVTDCSNFQNILKNGSFDKSVRLVPNPSTGIVDVLVSLTAALDFEISVYNSLGQEVYVKACHKITNEAISLDLRAFSNGLYTVKLTGESESSFKRLILLR